MLKPYIGLFNLCLMFAIFSTNTVADVYKWVDENGQTHYSQQAPAQQDAELLKTPPPPAFNPDAQQKVDELIEQQQADREARIKKQQEQQQAAKQLAIKQQNCKKAQNNLQQYQNNPSRRVLDAEGNVTKLQEEERQQRIKEFQQQVQEYCN